jgi:hypothetical protein
MLKVIHQNGCFIDPTDYDERTEGDTGRSVFSGIQFVV